MRRAALVLTVMLLASGCTKLTLLANENRIEHGQRIAAEHPLLMKIAQAHALEMSTTLPYLLHHNLPLTFAKLPLAWDGMPAEWNYLGEIVCGPAPSEEGCQDAWERSPEHEVVQVNPRYRWIGTGDARDATGGLWMVELFAG